ncbi:MAG: hypothetical protein LBP65_02040 [Puniceicoccales bacterium]|jgi:hypothetical protein|nr:hypothetical protein [Puniceicoccales bacterium]
MGWLGLLCRAASILLALSLPSPAAGDNACPVQISLANGKFLRAERMSLSNHRLTLTGGVLFDWKDGLLLAELLEISPNGRTLHGREVRCGTKFYRMRAAAVDQDGGDDIVLQNSDLFFGEPGPLTFHLAADRVTITADHRIILTKPSLFVGRLRLLRMAHCTLPLHKSPVYVKVHGGQRRDLGLFAGGEFSIFPSDRLCIGCALDGYASRGLMLGPIFHWRSVATAKDFCELSLRGGFIRDAGDAGRDVLGRSIGPNRFWGQTSIGARHGSWQFWGEWQPLSDSEVWRHFRSAIFSENQNPDTVFALRRHGAATIFTALLRPSCGDFQNVVQRLPELCLSIPPKRTAIPGIIAGGRCELALLRQPDNSKTDWPRGICIVELATHPLHLSSSAAPPLTLLPHLTLRAMGHGRSLEGGSTLRAAGEIGLDLCGEFFGTIRSAKKTFFFHRCSPVLHYRRMVQGKGKAVAQLAGCVDQGNYLPAIDLADPRSDDVLENCHVLRIGLQNSFFGQSREWGRCALWQDIALPSNDGPSSPAGFHADATFHPSPCLALAIRGHFGHGWRETFASVQFGEGIFWNISLESMHRHGENGQLRLCHHWRANSLLRLDTFFSYDVHRHRPIEQRHCLVRRLANRWLWEGSVAIRARSTEECRVQLGSSLATAF